jgi:hypothetical protein
MERTFLFSSARKRVLELEPLVAEACLRMATELALERAFAARLKAEPHRLGLETGLDVHRARRLEADLACERLSRRLDEARAWERASGGPNSQHPARSISELFS